MPLCAMKILEPVILNGMVDRRNVRLVAILFVICVVFQGRFTYDSIGQQLHVTEYARIPFAVNNPSGTVKTVQPEATAAGILETDRPVAIDGHSVRGLAGVTVGVRGRRAGDVIAVTVDRQGVPVSASIKLAPESPKPLSVQDWVLSSFLYYLIPWFCILLGFTVAFLRPDDLLAWLLLLLMLSFSAVTDSDAYVSTVAAWGHGYVPQRCFISLFSTGPGACGCCCSANTFPDRVSNDFWNRLARWVLGVPLAALTIVTAIVNVAVIEDATTIAGVQRLLTRLSPFLAGLMMTAISTFFINSGKKMVSAKTRDARRRLKLLYFGTFISLTPLFLLVIASLVMRRSLAQMPDWITVPALLLLFLFPLTLAYVIVVEKTMELRVVIRQGLQYALARRGVRVLTALATLAVVLIGVRLLNQPGVRGPRQLILIAFMVVIIIRLRVLAEKLRSWIDRRFFREAVNTERVLRELGDNVRSIVEMQPLLETVSEYDFLGAARCESRRHDATERIFRAGARAGVRQSRSAYALCGVERGGGTAGAFARASARFARETRAVGRPAGDRARAGAAVAPGS